MTATTGTGSIDECGFDFYIRAMTQKCPTPQANNKQCSTHSKFLCGDVYFKLNKRKLCTDSIDNYKDYRTFGSWYSGIVNRCSNVISIWGGGCV
jgi:hypothetical protein